MFGGFLLLGGRVADYLGHRRLYVSGLILFTAASLAGALAQSGLWLVIARGLQGLGAALVSPAALALLMALFDEGAERSKALGVWAALGGSGGAAGAILGPVLTDGLGWQAVLLVNVPVGAAAVALTPRLLPESCNAAGARGSTWPVRSRSPPAWRCWSMPWSMPTTPASDRPRPWCWQQPRSSCCWRSSRSKRAHSARWYRCGSLATAPSAAPTS
jgi:MFS family permease